MTWFCDWLVAAEAGAAPAAARTPASTDDVAMRRA
jgi:hypothetical protein